MNLFFAYVLAITPSICWLFGMISLCALLATAASVFSWADAIARGNEPFANKCKWLAVCCGSVLFVFATLFALTPDAVQLKSMMLNYHGEYIQCDVQGKCQEEK